MYGNAKSRQPASSIQALRRSVSFSVNELTLGCALIV